jgi:hypothetical protein
VETRDWSAWYNKMPGADDRNIHVAGTCVLPSSAATARLEPRVSAETDHPGLQMFTLIVEMPAIGDTSIAARQVTWDGDVGADITHVKIFVERGDDVDIDVVDAV